MDDLRRTRPIEISSHPSYNLTEDGTEGSGTFLRLSLNPLRLSHESSTQAIIKGPGILRRLPWLRYQKNEGNILDIG